MARDTREDLEDLDESSSNSTDYTRKYIDSYQPEKGELDDDNPPDEDGDSE